METSLPLNRRTALKLGLGTSIGGLLGLASTRAEEKPGSQQPSQTNANVGPRTDPPPLISKLKPELMAAYPTWEHDRFIEPAIRYFAS